MYYSMPQVDNVSLVERFSSRRNAVGSLYLTATHLIYVDHDNKRETWVRLFYRLNSKLYKLVCISMDFLKVLYRS